MRNWSRIQAATSSEVLSSRNVSIRSKKAVCAIVSFTEAGDDFEGTHAIRRGEHYFSEIIWWKTVDRNGNVVQRHE
uniref:Uncharacterized protein n=1 Tax=Steinernema glaseri TaxID=37863 RepID=A0A1I8A6Z7_9BILA